MQSLWQTPRDSAGDLVAAWRQATLAGNAHFELGEDGPARACYERARELALHRFTRWPCADDGVAALVVSTLNLAEVLLRGDDAEEACHLTAGLHRSLVDAAANATLRPALRDAARSHLRQTFAALVRLQERLGPRPAITRLLFDTCASDGPMTAH